MCIGIPMQVLTVTPGHALCAGRGETREVRTALVDAVAPGDWVLVFIDSVQDHIDARRASEINATLDLMQAALSGADSTSAAAFSLPSALSRDQLLALSGATPQTTLGEVP